LTAGGKYILLWTFYEKSVISFVNKITGALEGDFTIKGANVFNAGIDSEKKIIAILNEYESLQIYNIKSKKLVKTFENIAGFNFGYDGKSLYLLTKHGTIDQVQIQ